MMPHNCWDASPRAPGAESMFTATHAEAGAKVSTSTHDKCMEYVREYYRKNYCLLTSRHGNKCLLQDLERVLGVRGRHAQESRSTSGSSFQGQGYQPMEVYGHWGSCLQRRPTRRRYLSAGHHQALE